MQTPLRKHDIPVDNLQHLFDLCNARYFAGAIEPSEGFVLRWSRSVRLSGCFTFCLESHTDWGIEISSRLQDHPLAALSTMAHEMIHMLAHQNFRETGDAFYLDEEALPDRPFVNEGHGAFFLGEAERLNRDYPELQIDVKSTFGDALYEKDRIAPVRLLLVTIDKALGRGMIYRLHPEARNDWKQLRRTARKMHGVENIDLCQVEGHLAEGFPALKKNNDTRANMVPVGLRDFGRKAATLLSAPATRRFMEPSVMPLVYPDSAIGAGAHLPGHRTGSAVPDRKPEPASRPFAPAA